MDDLEYAESEPGAGMMGTVEFNLACFYRYANIGLSQLQANLKGDEELLRAALEAFLRACVEAVPTGKQNSMAAHNPPSLVFAVVRDSGLWNLANAFVDPVRPNGGGDLVSNSIKALENHWLKLSRAFGEDQIIAKAALCLDGQLGHLPAVETLEELVGTVMRAVTERRGER